MSAVDNLLDGLTKIVLTIDETTRTIKFDEKPIIGVKGDDCAERIYFKAPKILSEDIDLMGDGTDENGASVEVFIYVNYKNAYNEPYIQECTKSKTLQSDGSVLFSWIVTNNATIRQGDVKFNVCVKKVVGGKLENEWHTTTFAGVVLDSIDVTEKTPEVIAHDSVSVQSLILQVNEYTRQLNELNETLSDVNEYIDNKVESSIGDASAVIDLGEFTNTYFDETNDYLASVTTPGMYMFRVNNGSKNTPYILIVDNLYGTLIQNVYFNLSSGLGYENRSSTNNGVTWNDSNPEEFYAKQSEIRELEAKMPEVSDIILQSVTLNVSNVEYDTNSCTVRLNKVSAAGDKLRVHFHGPAGDNSKAVSNTFVIELLIVENGAFIQGTPLYTGQGSHFVCNGDWEGFINVSFDASDEQGQTLLVTAYSMMSGGQCAFTITKVEKISGNYKALI